MTTSDWIALLKKYEFGGATGRPREVRFDINGYTIHTDNVKVVCTGDGLVTDIDISLGESESIWPKWREYKQGDENEIPIGKYLCKCEGGEVHVATMTEFGFIFAHWVPRVIGYVPLPEEQEDE